MSQKNLAVPVYLVVLFACNIQTIEVYWSENPVSSNVLKDTWFIFEIYLRVYDRRGLFRMSLRAKSVLARESLSLAGIMLSKSWQKYCFLGLWLNQAPSHALFFQVFTWVLLTWFSFYYYYPTRMGYSWLFCFTLLYNSYY